MLGLTLMLIIEIFGPTGRCSFSNLGEGVVAFRSAKIPVVGTGDLNRLFGVGVGHRMDQIDAESGYVVGRISHVETVVVFDLSKNNQVQFPHGKLNPVCFCKNEALFPRGHLFRLGDWCWTGIGGILGKVGRLGERFIRRHCFGCGYATYYPSGTPAYVAPSEKGTDHIYAAAVREV